MRKLYHCAGARSMRSHWLLLELGLEFELVTLGFSMAALRAPEYLAISPLGRVPCLIDGDVTLIESGAICQYLCERYDDGRLHRATNTCCCTNEAPCTAMVSAKCNHCSQALRSGWPGARCRRPSS